MFPDDIYLKQYLSKLSVLANMFLMPCLKTSQFIE